MIKLALRSLLRKPGRTGLTVLSLAIGVAAFIAVVAFGTGARSAVLAQFENLGVDRLSVTRKVRPGAVNRPLTLDDVRALRLEAVGIDLVVPVVFQRSFVAHEKESHPTTIQATHPDYFEMHGLDFAVGGTFDDLDMKSRAKVCVLGATPARVLFGESDPVGRRITVAGVMRCRVVGVLASRGRTVSSRDLDDLVLMPHSTYFTFVRSKRPTFAALDVRPEPDLPRGSAVDQITRTLRRTHGLEAGDRNDFRIESPDDAIQVADEVATILTRLLAGIAAVSLIVGGIGIMNIQLVAVAERIREIGIRSAIGASPRQILTQFLIEAVLLAGIGAFIGCVIGAAVAVGVAQAMRWDQSIPVATVGLALSFGLGLGVGFGYLPALRAAQLDPIEALRRE
jgi:putative ABC transport system permease protein